MAKLSDIVIGVVLFGLIVTGLFTWHSGLAVRYNTTIDSQYVSTYNQLNGSISSMYDLSKDIETKVGKTESISATEGVALITKAALEAVKLPLKALAFVVSYLTLVANIIGLPNWLVIGIITMIIIGAAFLVLSAYLRKDV